MKLPRSHVAFLAYVAVLGFIVGLVVVH